MRVKPTPAPWIMLTAIGFALFFDAGCEESVDGGPSNDGVDAATGDADGGVVPGDRMDGSMPDVDAGPEADAGPQEEPETLPAGCEEEQIPLRDNITDDTTLGPGCYRVERGIEIMDGATLTVLPDTVFLMAEGLSYGFRIRSGGALNAVGTEDLPIRFLGETLEPGSWGGLWFESSSEENELTHVEVAHGGGGDFSNVRISGSSRVKITSSVIRNGGGLGIDVQAGGATLPDFADNSFRGNAESGLRIHASQIRFMDGVSVFEGNGEDVILVRGGTLDDDPHVWPKTTAPYLMGRAPHSNGIDVQTDVEVEPGLEMRMADDGRAQFIRVRDSGSLKAVGTEDEPIRFLGEAPEPGAWGGLWFESDTEDNRLVHTEIAYGGEGDRSNVEISSGARVFVEDSTIRHSADWGIRMRHNSTSFLDGDQDTNHFEGNVCGNVGWPGDSCP